MQYGPLSWWRHIATIIKARMDIKSPLYCISVFKGYWLYIRALILVAVVTWSQSQTTCILASRLPNNVHLSSRKAKPLIYKEYNQLYVKYPVCLYLSVVITETRTDNERIFIQKINMIAILLVYEIWIKLKILNTACSHNSSPDTNRRECKAMK